MGNQHDRSIRRVLEWLLNRDITDAEMAKAIPEADTSYDCWRCSEHRAVKPKSVKASKV